MPIVFEMSSSTLNNINVQFDAESISWKFYTFIKALSNTHWVELINKYKFVIVALDGNTKTFLVHIAILKAPELIRIIIHSFKSVQIGRANPA